MKFKQKITYIYQCETCGAEYESEVRMKAKRKAERCEKLPVEEKKFEKGDKVELIAEHYKVGITDVISAVKLYSPVDNDYLVSQMGVSEKSHFYLYDVRSFLGVVSTHPARELKKLV